MLESSEEVKDMKNGNGKKAKAEIKPKPKYSIHDYKEKKRYTRAEREKMELGAEFMDIIRKSLEKNEQIEKTDV